LRNDFLIELLDKPPAYHSFWLYLSAHEGRAVSVRGISEGIGITQSYGHVIWQWVLSSMQRNKAPVMVEQRGNRMVVTFRDPEPAAKASAAETKAEQVISEVIRYLNNRTRKNYRLDLELHRRPVRKALKSHTPEQLIRIINVKSDEWMGTKMETYLRPKTLFGDKLDIYLNQNETNKKTSAASGPVNGASTLKRGPDQIREDISVGREVAKRLFRNDNEPD
jgi:uncharacterized phage protein (TIGR02220 family)